MYLEKAIEKINNVKWDAIGSTVSEDNAELGYEFLRRLAQFYKERGIRPLPPMFSNIAKLLGDSNEKIDISKYGCFKAAEFLGEFNKYIYKMVGYYIQLAKYADEHPEFGRYISVYEPLIRIFERGGSFVIRIHDLEIMNVVYIPLGEWYERFVDKEPFDISHL